MTLPEALILGLVQGLTEFLPVSSSAHLVLVQHLLGFKEPLLFFDVVLHAGTLVSLILYFAADLAHVIRDSIYAPFFFLRRKSSREIYEIAPHARWGWGIVLATVPTAIIGFAFHDWFEGLFGSLHAVGIALLGTTAILWFTRGFRTGTKQISLSLQGEPRVRWFDFVVVGLFQALAILPGISRSGSTIAAGLFRGFKPDDAFRFAFLLAIPAIAGASILEMSDGLAGMGSEGLTWFALCVGFVTAAGFGYLSLSLLARIVRKGKFHAFAFYTLPLALLVLLASRWLE